MRVVPYAVSAQAGQVVYHNLDELVCLETKTGDKVWRAPSKITSTVGAASTLVISDGVVLFHGHGQPPAGGGEQKRNKAKSKASKKGKKRKIKKDKTGWHSHSQVIMQGERGFYVLRIKSVYLEPG